MGIADRENERAKKTSQNEVDHGAIKQMLDTTFETERQRVSVPEKEETRSKRINIIAKPSTQKRLQDKCKKMGISVNECINQLIEDWVEHN